MQAGGGKGMDETRLRKRSRDTWAIRRVKNPRSLGNDLGYCPSLSRPLLFYPVLFRKIVLQRVVIARHPSR